jgi:nucleoside-triphosphatase
MNTMPPPEQALGHERHHPTGRELSRARRAQLREAERLPPARGAATLNEPAERVAARREPMRTRAPRGHVLLITGRPGSGKTTVIRKVAEVLGRERIAGFYTAEIRGRAGRQGFRLVAFDGREAIMAHVDFEGPDRVGKYGVDTGILDDVARSALRVSGAVDIYVVDEIGKMECLSPEFVTAMRALLDSSKPVVATVGQRGGGFIDEVKRRSDALLWELTLDNRDGLPGRVLAWIRTRGRTGAVRRGLGREGRAKTISGSRRRGRPPS